MKRECMQLTRAPRCILVCLVIMLRTVSALQVVMRPLVRCEPVMQRWDLSNASILNTAFLWTKGMPLENWAYDQSKGQPFQTPNDECVHAEYDTLVPVPFFFVSYTGDSRQKVHISKSMCTNTPHTKLQEVITVRNIPFIDSMLITIEGSLRESDVRLVADWELSLPWYLELLREKIEKHVKKSLQEYLQLLANTTCQAKLNGSATGVKAEKKSLQIRVHHRLPASVRPWPKQQELWRL